MQSWGHTLVWAQHMVAYFERKKYSSRHHGRILVAQVTAVQLSQWTIRVKHILCLMSKDAMARFQKETGGASASAPWGRVVPEYAQRASLRTAFILIRCPHLTLLEWRVSLSSDGATLLNYNWNLLKHCFLKTLYLHTPALFKMKKDMNKKISKCCLFPSSS